jgi:ankyrin repeat protein
LTPAGYTPLHIAVWHNNAEATEALVQAGADVNAVAHGECPLIIAAQKGFSETLKVLLASDKLDTSVTDREGVQVLGLVPQSGSSDAIAVLLADPRIDRNHLSKAGDETSHALYRHADGDLASMALLAADPTVHLQAESWQGLMQRSLRAKKADATERLAILLDRPEVASGVRSAPETYVQLAVESNNLSALTMLLSRPEVVTSGIGLERSVELAIQANSTPALEILQRAGAVLSARDLLRRTPMHRAALLGFVEVAAGLVELGQRGTLAMADVAGMTPLLVAAHAGHLPFVEFCLVNGSEVSEKNYEGWSALHFVVQADQLDMALMLMKSGAPCEPTIQGLTLPAIAAEAGALNTCRLLLDTNVSADADSRLFALAARGGHVQVLELLLSRFGENRAVFSRDMAAARRCLIERSVVRTTARLALRPEEDEISRRLAALTLGHGTD